MREWRLAGTIAACLVGLLVFAGSAAATSYAPAETYGSFGSGDGQLNTPTGVTVDSRGFVYVVDTGNDRIVVFDAAGEMVLTFGESGSGPGQFDTPIDIALGADSGMWVTDEGNNQVLRFNASGEFISAISTRFGGAALESPFAIDANPQGEMFVTEATGNRVQRYSAAGVPVSSFGATATGEVSGSASGIAVDSAGNIHVGDTINHRIEKFSPAGAFISSVGTSGTGPGQFSAPFALDFDSQGNSLVSDYGNKRVQEFSLSGSVIALIQRVAGSEGVPDPYGVAVGPADAVYVSFPNDHLVQRFVLKRDLTVSRGGSGVGSVTSSPAGINCPGTCASSSDPGSVVTLTATASAGSVFTGWSGGGCAGTGTCPVTMNADATVTANFALDRRLTVTRKGTGAGTVTSVPAGIDCGSACTTTYREGTAVTLKATPAAGTLFAGWSGDCSGTADCSSTMSTGRNVTATFNLKPAPPAAAKAPKVRITAKPAKKTKSRKASFKFRADVAGSKFLCRIDKKKFTGCSSPKAYRGLKPGKHTFQVKAKAAGLTGALAAYSWKVKK